MDTLGHFSEGTVGLFACHNTGGNQVWHRTMATVRLTIQHVSIFEKIATSNVHDVQPLLADKLAVYTSNDHYVDISVICECDESKLLL